MHDRLGMLKHRHDVKRLRETAPSPSNARVSAERRRLSDGDGLMGLSVRHAPVTIHEHISLVTLQQTAGKSSSGGIGSGARPAHNPAHVRSLSATRPSSNPARAIDRSRPHKSTSQRASLSEDVLSAVSGSHPDGVHLPALLRQRTKGESLKPACRKSARPKHNTSTKSQKSQTKRASKEVSQQPPKQKEAAKKPRALPILAAITPDNVEQEKQRFFDSHYQYNPQFTYHCPPSPKALARFSKASDKLIELAILIFRATLERFQSYERFQTATGGRPISAGRFRAIFQQYLAGEGLTNKVALNLSDSLVARALMTRTNGRPTLNARPNALRLEWSDGLLRHEIGTHYIRSANTREHPWSSAKGRRLHHLAPANPTEEGLASLHSVLLRREPFLWRSAMLYYTAYMASQLSLADLFRDLGAYIEDPEVRWDYCLRAKRGQLDTSSPGCFNKDQVYLEGALRVLRYRHVVDFHSLYKLGKVALEDVERLKAQTDLASSALKIPSFAADIGRYRKQLDRVLRKNGVEDDQLVALFPGETPATMFAPAARPEDAAEADADLCSSSDELG